MKYNRGVPLSQLDSADDFYEAYIRCFNPDAERHIVGIPGFVCGLFASELYFKSIIGKKLELIPNVKQSHNLLELYQNLDQDKKDQLKSIPIEREEYDIENLLKMIGKGFVEWRYIFEDDNESFGKGRPFEYTDVFLCTYLPVLRDMAKDSIN